MQFKALEEKTGKQGLSLDQIPEDEVLKLFNLG